MKFKQRVKQFFCKHTQVGVKHYPAPFLGHLFQCPKCNEYVAYFKEWNKFVGLRESWYQFYLEEGEKIRGKIVWYDGAWHKIEEVKEEEYGD